MSRTGTKTARIGCSGVVALILVPFALFIIFVWPSYLDRHGSAASGVISDKYETIRIEYSEWFRRLEVVATYSIPGQPLQHRASCDVDEKTYDSLHAGNTVAVHYFAPLLQQPFVDATHLAPCSTAASLGLGSPLLPRFVIAFLPLLAILFLWRVLRIKMAVWLLFAWIVFAFALIGLPRVEAEPRQPVPGTATVYEVATITTLGALPWDKTIPLERPYQIVVLKFVPPGMDTPVMAVDKIDSGSVPNLKQGQSANIIYDAAHPRIARLQQGTRAFPGNTLRTVIVSCLAYVVVVVVIGSWRSLI